MTYNSTNTTTGQQCLVPVFSFPPPIFVDPPPSLTRYPPVAGTHPAGVPFFPAPVVFRPGLHATLRTPPAFFAPPPQVFLPSPLSFHSTPPPPSPRMHQPFFPLAPPDPNAVETPAASASARQLVGQEAVDTPAASTPITEDHIQAMVRQVIAHHAAALAQHQQMALAQAVAALQRQVAGQMQQRQTIGGLGGGVGETSLDADLMDCAGVGDVGPPALEKPEEELECEKLD